MYKWTSQLTLYHYSFRRVPENMLWTIPKWCSLVFCDTNDINNWPYTLWANKRSCIYILIFPYKTANRYLILRKSFITFVTNFNNNNAWFVRIAFDTNLLQLSYVRPANKPELLASKLIKAPNLNPALNLGHLSQTIATLMSNILLLRKKMPGFTT